MIPFIILACFLAYFLPTILRFVAQQIKHARYAKDIPGFPTNPILGNAHQVGLLPMHEFTRMFLAKTNEITASGGDVIKMWILNKLYLFPLTGEAAKDILESSTEIVKGSDYDFIVPWLGTGLLTSTGKKWATRRKMLTPTFHFAMLESYVLTFDQECRKMVDLLEAIERDATVDMFQYVKRCALDIICDTAMGVTVNAQEEHDSQYVAAVGEMGHIVQVYALSPWLWNPVGWRLSGYKTRYDKSLKVLLDFTNKVIRDRSLEFSAAKAAGESVYKNEERGGKKRLAFLDMLLEMNDTNQLTEEDIREEVDTFMFEGHDTTSSGIAWSLWCLACHPEIQQRCVEEMNTIFGDSDRDCTLDDIKQMTYLDRCIKEAMRICPPVPLYNRKLINDIKIGQHIGPAGAQAAICPLFIHNNAQLYPSPSTFDPDRFLPENSAGRHAYDYVPFSAGPRNCIGQKFAAHEEKVMVSWVLRRFTLEATLPFLENERCPEVVLRPLHGIPLKLHRRK